MDKGNTPLNIYIDLYIDHTILLDKLDYYGIKDKALDFLQSHLKDRY